jgi:hypothetical protein
MMTEHLVQIAEKRRRLYTRPSVPKYNTVLLDGFKNDGGGLLQGQIVAWLNQLYNSNILKRQ